MLLWLFIMVVGMFASANMVVINSYINADDKAIFTALFTNTISSKQKPDISAIHHSVSGLKLIGAPPIDTERKKIVCDIAKSADFKDTKAIYHASAIAADTDGCELTIPDAKSAIDAVATSGTKVTSQDIYYALSAAQRLNIKVDSAKFDAALQAALKADDSANSLSYGLNAAVFLDKLQATKYLDRVEDLVGQADEVDSKYLQFEGGLSVTATAIYGIYALADKLNKAPAIKSDETVKFANYLINRKSVRMERPAFLLLRAIKKLAQNNFQVPVALTLSSSVAVTSANPKVVLRLSNMFGETVGALSVHIDSATHLASSGVVLSRKQLTRVADDNTNTLYEFNLLEQPRERGFYRLSITAGSQDKRLIGTNGAEVQVKVMTEITIDDVELAVFDREHGEATSFNKVPSGGKYSTILDADVHQKFVIKFSIKDKQTRKAITVHQAFVAFVFEKTKQELLFVAEPDSATSSYKFDVDFEKSAKDFVGLGGKYNVRLIVGDSVVINSIDWNLVDVNVKLPPYTPTKVKKSEQILYDKLPEIKHLFREPEKRPSGVVSDLFTILCIAPILILLALWFKIGVNVSNFPFSIWAIGFHVGLAGIFGLYFVFWLQLNMFVTLKYLSIIGALTFFFGNRLLRAKAEQRNPSKTT